MFRSFDADQDGLLEQADLARAFSSMVCFSKLLFMSIITPLLF